MPNRKNYWTQKRPDRRWESKGEGDSRASKVTDTQAEAWAHSRDMARQGGGEAFLKGCDGKIRKRNSYGSDPHPPEG